MKKQITAILLVTLMLTGLTLGINASSTDPEVGEFYYGTPVVDGEIEDLWDSVPAYYVQYNWSGTSDKPLDTASAYFKGMWDEEYVYLLAYVSDKTLNTADHEKESWSANQFWQVDSHHFFMDFSNDGNLDFKLEIMAYGQDRGNFSQFADFYEFSHKTGSDYYYFEAKIEASKIDTTFKNAAGSSFRLDYQVNDNTNFNIGSREECYLWNDETGTSNGTANGKLCGIINLVATKATSASAEAVIEIVEAAPTPVAESTAAPTPAAAVKAPQTNDSLIVFVVIGLLSTAVLFTYKMRKSV